MMRIVCEEGKRPPLPEQCSRDEVTNYIKFIYFCIYIAFVLV